MKNRCCVQVLLLSVFVLLLSACLSSDEELTFNDALYTWQELAPLDSISTPINTDIVIDTVSVVFDLQEVVASSGFTSATLLAGEMTEIELKIGTPESQNMDCFKSLEFSILGVDETSPTLLGSWENPNTESLSSVNLTLIHTDILSWLHQSEFDYIITGSLQDTLPASEISNVLISRFNITFEAVE